MEKCLPSERSPESFFCLYTCACWQSEVQGDKDVNSDGQVSLQIGHGNSLLLGLLVPSTLNSGDPLDHFVLATHT